MGRKQAFGQEMKGPMEKLPMQLCTDIDMVDVGLLNMAQGRINVLALTHPQSSLKNVPRSIRSDWGETKRQGWKVVTPEQALVIHNGFGLSLIHI